MTGYIDTSQFVELLKNSDVLGVGNARWLKIEDSDGEVMYYMCSHCQKLTKVRTAHCLDCRSEMI